MKKKEIESITVDPSAASFIECINRHGKFRVIPAKNEVLDGIRKVSDALRDGKILFSPSCKDTLREFGLYRWEQTSVRDAPRKEHDHAMDDIRYFVTTVICREREEFYAFAAARK